jgi:hypothetical protein
MGKGGQWEQAQRAFDGMAAAGECPARFTNVPSLDQPGSAPARACTVDLHGCPAAVAVTAVAFVLRAIQRAASAAAEADASATGEPSRRLTIITGRGLHSEQTLQPVLRPQVCGGLAALVPPLRWSRADGNDGRVEVSAGDVGEGCAASGDGWVAHLRPLGEYE